MLLIIIFRHMHHYERINNTMCMYYNQWRNHVGQGSGWPISWVDTACVLWNRARQHHFELGHVIFLAPKHISSHPFPNSILTTLNQLNFYFFYLSYISISLKQGSVLLLKFIINSKMFRTNKSNRWGLISDQFL